MQQELSQIKGGVRVLIGGCANINQGVSLYYCPTLNSLLIKIASFTIYNRANNLASMLDVITIPYLFALQAISPLNSFIIYPYKLFLLIELSINNTSLVQINNCTLLLLSLLLSRPLLYIPLSLPLPFIPSLSPLQQITLLLILYRYQITLSTTQQCSQLRF